MAKILFAAVLLSFLFNITISFSCFFENQKERRYAKAEADKATAVLIRCIEDNQLNQEFIKVGDTEGLKFDKDSLFSEFSVFLDNCRYIDKSDIRMKILIFEDTIWFFNAQNEEMYVEKFNGIETLETKIKRQLSNAFSKEGFVLSSNLFEGLQNQMLIAIYQKRYRNIGFIKEIKNRYDYSKIRITR